MAEEEIQVEGEQEEKKKGKGKLLIIIILAVVLLGGGAAAWFFFFAGGEKPEAKDKAKEEKKVQEEVKPGVTVQMEPFIVNLADPGGKRYLKLTLVLEADNEQVKQKLETRLPKIRDSILLLLTSKTYKDVATVAGKLRLRNEILQIVNRALGGGVHSVYFTDFVIQ